MRFIKGRLGDTMQASGAFWRLNIALNQCKQLELAKGFEPPTGGLQIRCSTN